MLQLKPAEKLSEVSSFNLCDRKTHEIILQRQLSKPQLSFILRRIKNHLRKEKQPQILSQLNQFKKELRAKYSINISNDIIDRFISTTEKVNSPRGQLDFYRIDKEIKNSLGEVSKKKHYLNSQNKKVTFTKKIISAQKKKRRNVLYNLTNQPVAQIRSMKNLDHMFIEEKTAIFQNYLDEDEIKRFQEELQRKVDAVSHLNYGRYAQRIKHYTVDDLVLQRVFSLIQEDTKNIDIRTRFQNIYRRMKEEMVSIVTNQEDITNAVKRLKEKSQEKMAKNLSRNHQKKNYFQLQREKPDLMAQIEETLQGAKKHIKEAFIKSGRPEFAYEMEQIMENRKTMPVNKRTRF